MPISPDDIWLKLEPELAVESGHGSGSVPILKPQVIWLAAQAATYENGRALDIGFGCGFSAVSMALGGGMDVVAATLDSAGSARLKRAQERCERLCGSKVRIEKGVSSDMYLPFAAKNRDQYDLIFVDGGHRFDDVFVDVHYAGRLAKPGGLMVLDDTHFGAIRSVANWVNTNLSHLWEPFEICRNIVSWKRIGSDDLSQEHRRGSGRLLKFSIATENSGKYQRDPALDLPLQGDFAKR